MKQNKFINIFIAVIFGFSATLNASILPNFQILQSNLNSVSIENPRCISKSNYNREATNQTTQSIKAKDYEAIISATVQNEYAEIGSNSALVSMANA
ncbi:hypothetical protein OFO10_04890 [Campylobacter sp. VBCF_06 NA8]|uniref:hypothetical protein n=1 Tax=Campylobacter sp. VBCF_06 NA8 TaxID=2983822 RepID=UPI0022EA0B4B|nr:hypothetical protein [Campylobacter sp. VBCF_06 NA8]MDA3046488.1 hypothetical protein [Campylobacter sp. VBCF_06 NA8]